MLDLTKLATLNALAEQAGLDSIIIPRTDLEALIAEVERLRVACAELLGMIDAAVDAGMNGSISNRCITTDKARAALARATQDA